MLFALLAGFLFALGHHVFYVSLEHKAVPSRSYSFAGTNSTKQQINTSVGIAFAVLVKIFSATAVSIAYVQVLWRSAAKTKHNPTLAELDWANANLANVFIMLNVKLGWKHPSLVLLTLFFWCVPMALDTC